MDSMVDTYTVLHKCSVYGTQYTAIPSLKFIHFDGDMNTNDGITQTISRDISMNDEYDDSFFNVTQFERRKIQKN